MMLNGAECLFLVPDVYHHFVPTAAWNLKLQIICDWLATIYVLFAFKQIVTLSHERCAVLESTDFWNGPVRCRAHTRPWARMGTRDPCRLGYRDSPIG